MANEHCIVPYQFRSGDEARESGAKGGVASGEARRRKKSLREAAKTYLAMPPTDTSVWNSVSMAGIDPEDIDNQMALVVSQTQKAIAGDTKAAKLIADIVGVEDQTEEEETENE